MLKTGFEFLIFNFFFEQKYKEFYAQEKENLILEYLLF